MRICGKKILLLMLAGTERKIPHRDHQFIGTWKRIVLVLGLKAEKSGTPASKSVVV